jgi:TolB protein
MTLSVINTRPPASRRLEATGACFIMLFAPTALLSLAILGWIDPASERLVVCSFRTGELELFAVDPATGDAVNLTRSPKSVEKYPACSYAGDRVAFISNRHGTDNLYVMNADGSEVRQLTHEKPGIDAGMASWTADGRWLYFGLYGGGPPRMCRIRPDGSDFKVVGEGIDPAVSPDGQRIAFARPLGDGHHLFVMKSDGSDAHQLAKSGNGWGGVHATWTPDGKRIIYGDKVGEAIELFACEPDSGPITQLTRLGGAATSPSVSHDGRWITFRLCDEVYWRSGESSERAYRERRADKRPVWIMKADGSDPHVIEPLHYQTTIDGSRAPFLK